MIRAGTEDQVVWGDGNWIFLDIGFSEKNESCGLIIHRSNDIEKETECEFGNAQKFIVGHIKQSTNTITNLVIEAPLSVCFNLNGNPAPRAIEKMGKKHCYWYENLGCQVMTAAGYVIRDVYAQLPKNKTVRLFEGFVAFKEETMKSGQPHLDDAKALRNVVKVPRKEQIVKPESLRTGGPKTRRVDVPVTSAFPEIYTGAPWIIKP